MNTLFSLRRVFAVDKGEHDYVNVSASPSQIGGGGADVKNCVYLWKNSGYAPVLYCIHHLWAPLYQVNLNKLKSQGKELTSASGKIIMGLRWPEPIYMCVGYVLKSRFSAGKMWSISMILVILNNEWSNFKKLLFIFL